MTATWNGYPPNPNEHGMHVIASKLGRNPMVYKWHPDFNFWVDGNSLKGHLPREMEDMTYIGRVVV